MGAFATLPITNVSQHPSVVTAEKYCRAIFGSRLASRFCYTNGLASAEFAFWEYVVTVFVFPATATAPLAHPRPAPPPLLRPRHPPRLLNIFLRLIVVVVPRLGL